MVVLSFCSDNSMTETSYCQNCSPAHAAHGPIGPKLGADRGRCCS